MDPYIGKMLDDRYEILEEIGSGGMAVVYKAMCHRLNRLVAIKILKQELGKDAELHRRFLAESQAVAMLSHPNIVSVYDVSSSGDMDYIVMELIEGVTLKQYMQKRGALSWREALHFAMQIASALEHAHSRGIVHRDIKPQNIMLLKDGTLKVADFGIARVLSSQTTLTRETLGSVHYISPEQARGSRVDQRTDLYSLGVVLYEMLTGQLPYDGDSAVSIAIAHIGGKCPQPRELVPEIPEGLEQIVLHAMSVKLSERYETATQMLEDMEAFREDQQILFPYSHTPTEELVPPEQPVQQQEDEHESHGSRAGIIAVVAFMVVAFVGIGYFLYSYILKDLFSVTEELDAPVLVGRSYQELNDPQYSDFNIVVDKWVYSEDAEYGIVVSQNPSSGKKIKAGTTISVTVSQGAQDTLMPQVLNLNQSAAEQLLKAMDLDLTIRTVRETSDVFVSGQVMRSEPASGEKLSRGDVVVLHVSSGSVVELVKVPHLLGMEVDDALQAIDNAGLQRGTVLYRPSDEPKDTVIGQSSPPDVQIKRETVINLTVSLGPEEKDEKDKDPEEEEKQDPEQDPWWETGEQGGKVIEVGTVDADPGNPRPGEYTSQILEITLPVGVGTVNVVIHCDGAEYYRFVANLENRTVRVRVYGSGTHNFEVTVNSQRCYSGSVTFPVAG